MFHVYPESGVAALCQAVARDLPPDSIRLSTPARRIEIEGGAAVGVATAGATLDADLVVSTAPINPSPTWPPADVLEEFRPFRFRPMIFVNVKCEGERLLEDVVVWVPNESPLFRLTGATRSMPWLAPPGKTVVLCDIGAELGDGTWSLSDDALSELCLDHLEPIVPDIRKRVLGTSVLRVPLAYPVFLRSYEMARVRLQETTGVPGLLSVRPQRRVRPHPHGGRVLARRRANPASGRRLGGLALMALRGRQGDDPPGGRETPLDRAGTVVQLLAVVFIALGGRRDGDGRRDPRLIADCVVRPQVACRAEMSGEQ